jgi:hypothetical protein
MANVLRNQRDQQVSDLLFIIRQAESAAKIAKQLPSSSLPSDQAKLGGKNAHSLKGLDFDFARNDGQVPGGQLSNILDMVTNYSPQSAVFRHPSVKTNSTTSSQGSIREQRRSNYTFGQQQARSKSPPPSANDLTASLVSSTAASPPSSRQPSCPDAAPAHSETMAAISKRHGCISKNMTTDSKKRKERSSFKQQLKRLISWGTFGSLKQKGSRSLTIVTTPSPDSPHTATEKGSTLPHSAFTSISSSSGKSFPDPLDKSPQLKKDNQLISASSNDDENSHSRAPSTPPPLSASTLSASPSPLDQWQHVDSALALSKTLYDQHQHPDEIQEQMDNETSLPAKASNDSHISGGYTSTSTSSSSNHSESTAPGNSGRSSYQNDGDDCLASSIDDDDDKLNAHMNIDATRPCESDRPAPLPLCNNTSGGIPVRQGDFDDDFFLLVTQGVDYLKAKECTRWDDEEKGSGRSKGTPATHGTKSPDSALATAATPPASPQAPSLDDTPLVETGAVDETQGQVASSTVPLKEPSVNDEVRRRHGFCI